jgi:hypothetical protein
MLDFFFKLAKNTITTRGHFFQQFLVKKKNQRTSQIRILKSLWERINVYGDDMLINLIWSLQNVHVYQTSHCTLNMWDFYESIKNKVKKKLF